MKQIIYVFFAFLPFSLYAQIDNQLEIDAIYKNGEGKGINRIIKESNNLYAIGAYTQLFDVSNSSQFNLITEIRNWGEGANYDGRDGYIIGDYLYVVGRSNGYGWIYNSTPKLSFDFEDGISNFAKKIGPFDNYTHDGDSFIDELGIPCPNLGFSSARLFSRNNCEVMLEKTIDPTKEAYISLWINVDAISETKYTKIPLLSNGLEGNICLKVRGYKHNKVQLAIQTAKDEFTAEPDIKKNEWYCLKLHIKPKEVELYYRTKECGDWNPIIREGIDEDTNITAVCLGSLSEDESLIYIDDYYYHPTNIDKVSYINGKFTIYDKKTLKRIKYLNLDIRPNSLQVRGNYLYLCCLRGINVYDISTPDNPVLVLSHRRDKYIEYQGSDIFEKDGRVYLIVSLYRDGTAIFDITKPEQTFLVKEIPIRNHDEWKACTTFSVICRYPFAYSTLTVYKENINSQYDRRGVLRIDLTDFDNIEQKLYEIPNDVKPDIKSDGDTKPNRISQYHNLLFLNNATAGFLVFKIDDDGEPVYQYNQEVPGNSVVNAVSAFDDGLLFVGDHTSGSSEYPDINIYKYNLSNENSSGIHDVYYYWPEVWYTLSGERLSKKPTRKGLYILGNKKVVIE